MAARDCSGRASTESRDFEAPGLCSCANRCTARSVLLRTDAMDHATKSRKSSLRIVHGLTIAVAALTLAGNADAKGPYITLKDDGTLSNKITGPATVLEKVVKQYDAAGAARPDVISVWTAFPQNKNDVETLYTPASNDVTGIGLDDAYGGDGTFDDDGYAPLKAVLLHNNIFAMKKR